MIHSGHRFLYHRSPGNTLRRSLYGAALALLLNPSTVAPVKAQTTFGWIPKKTTRNNGDGSDYDWGKLTAKYTDTFNGNVSYPLFLGEDYFGYSDTLDFGTYPNGVEVDITGKSLFRWVWTPPKNPIDGFIYNSADLQPNDPGQPFPTPPLYVVR